MQRAGKEVQGAISRRATKTNRSEKGMEVACGEGVVTACSSWGIATVGSTAGKKQTGVHEDDPHNNFCILRGILGDTNLKGYSCATTTYTAGLSLSLACPLGFLSRSI